MLEIKNLQVSIKGKEILKGIDLKIKAGEIHAIMGQNGSGKTTLARVIAGIAEDCEIKGQINFLGKNILKMKPEERARSGIFLAFQNPLEIPGVPLVNFLRASLNEIYKAQKKPLLDPVDFNNFIEEKVKISGFKKEFLSRGVNQGASGGEKKINEIFQLQVLEPKLAILDEIDSGLDIDSLKKVSQVIKNIRKEDNAFLIITHYQRILNYLRPDRVHVLINGKIVKSGDFKLALEVEKKGYEGLG